MLSQFCSIFHGNRTGQISQHIFTGCSHVAQSIDTDIHTHDSCRQSRNGGQSCKRSYGTSRYPRCSDTKQCIRKHHHGQHAKAYLHTAGIGKKYDHKRHDNGNRIHINGRSQGKRQRRYFIRNSQLICAALADRQCGRAGAGSKNSQCCSKHGCKETTDTTFSEEFSQTAIHEQQRKQWDCWGSDL